MSLPAETLLERARALVGSGRAAAARPLLAAARRLGGDAAAIDVLDAELLMQGGRLAEACTVLDDALARAPAQAELRMARARARLAAADAAGAARDAAEVVGAGPRAPAGAKAVLGMALAELGRLADAETCLAEALRDAPGEPAWRLALARVRSARHDEAGARRTLEEGIACAPASLAVRREAIRAAVRRGDWAEAVALAEAARRAGLLDAALLGLQGEALTALGRDAEAGEAFADACKLAPEDARLRHLAAAAGHLPAPPWAPDAFVAAHFATLAARWHDAPEGLRAGPGLAARLVRAHLPNTAGAVLDLGCGTGAVAEAVQPMLPGAWHGVDLCGEMLGAARDGGRYAMLHHAAMQAMLAAPGPRFAAIAAVGSPRFLGPPEPFLAAIAARLRAGGVAYFAFAPLPDGAGWRLLPDGSYAHAPDRIAAAAAAAGLDTCPPEFGRDACAVALRRA